MIREHSGQINQRFNPTNIQFDEHGSTAIAIKSAFGKKFLKTSTWGWDYCVDKHKKYFNSSEVEFFCFSQCTEEPCQVQSRKNEIDQFDFQTEWVLSKATHRHARLLGQPEK